MSTCSGSGAIMKLILASDIHSEFKQQPQVPPLPDCDLLVLAGDIANGDIGLWWAGQITCEKQTPVVYTPGNHEYYGWSQERLTEVYREFEHPNVYLLNPGILEFEDFVIIGATLRSALTLPGYKDYPPDAFGRAIGDFQVVAGWTPEMHIAQYKYEAAFIGKALQEHRKKRCIVVTHFVPTMQCIHPRYKDDPLNPYFINDLDSMIDLWKPELWLFGHTHMSFDQIHSNGKTRLICNPRGYPGEHSKRFKWKEIELV